MLVQRWPFHHGQPGRQSWSGERRRPGCEGGHEQLRSRRPVARRSMRPHAVVVLSPALDHNFGLPQRVENLSIQQFVSQPTSVTPIERIASATLRPCQTSTSTWRSLATISSGLCLFLTRDPSSFSSHEPYFKADHLKGGGSQPNTSRPAPGHKVYPYLLRGVSVDRPNQVWAMDITYVPMARGFVSLAAVVDWFSRRVLSWQVSITLEAAFCVEALEDALARHGRPEVFNTDQGSQFTSHDFTGVLLRAGIALSMDGKGSWRDNVVVERLWRSIKDEEVYLRASDTVSDARASIARYLAFSNGRRPHSSLDRLTPDQASFNRLPQSVAA